MEQFKEFVNKCIKDPSLIHNPELAFFKDYVESFGGTIPSPPAKESGEAKGCPFSQGSAQSEEPKDPTPEEPSIPEPELDNSGVIEPDSGEPLPMGDVGKEATEEDLEKANDERSTAQAAFADGDFEKALKHFTAAIELNPGSAMLHGKRANCLIKLNRPVAAIADCDKAININADSATGYKFRGRANRLLGKWLEAHADLATACKLDYDDVANEWLKEVEPNAKKLREHHVAVDRYHREKEINERKERIRKAQEANKKAAEEESKRFADDDFAMPGSMPGGMGAFQDMLKDPEIMTAMQDPELMPIISEIMSNPSALMKHMGNPKVMSVIGKMKGLFGAGGPGMDCGSGCNDPHCGESVPGAGHAPPPPPYKAPDCDLD